QHQAAAVATLAPQPALVLQGLQQAGHRGVTDAQLLGRGAQAGRVLARLHAAAQVVEKFALAPGQRLSLPGHGPPPLSRFGPMCSIIGDNVKAAARIGTARFVRTMIILSPWFASLVRPHRLRYCRTKSPSMEAAMNEVV